MSTYSDDIANCYRLMQTSMIALFIFPDDNPRTETSVVQIETKYDHLYLPCNRCK